MQQINKFKKQRRYEQEINNLKQCLTYLENHLTKEYELKILHGSLASPYIQLWEDFCRYLARMENRYYSLDCIYCKKPIKWLPHEVVYLNSGKASHYRCYRGKNPILERVIYNASEVEY